MGMYIADNYMDIIAQQYAAQQMAWTFFPAGPWRSPVGATVMTQNGWFAPAPAFSTCRHQAAFVNRPGLPESVAPIASPAMPAWLPDSRRLVYVQPPMSADGSVLLQSAAQPRR